MEDAMSQETSAWLNQNVLIGMTDQRGRAWHYRASDQGDEPNHYPGRIPVPDLHRRLFHWTPIALPIYARVPADMETADGIDDAGHPYRWLARPGRQNIVRSDTYADLGVFRGGYVPHDFGQALVGSVAAILDDDLGVSSAGLLKDGAVAWVEVSVPESMTTASGVEYRPNLVACSSLDGSMATTYKRTITAVVCDNTLSAAMSIGGQQYKVRHSRYSEMKIADAREALQIVYSSGDAFAAEVDRLCDRKMTDAQWEVVLKEVIPDADSTGGRTRVGNRRSEIDRLYRTDERVAPWMGSAFGALQAFNTFNHHIQRCNEGTIRAERNMLNSINGTAERNDAQVLAALVTAGV